MGRFERMEEAPPTPSSMLRPAEVETPLLGRGLAAQEPPLLSPRHKRLGGIVLATAAALVIAGFVLGRSTNDASAPTGGASAPSAAGGALPARRDAAETSPSAATTATTTTAAARPAVVVRRVDAHRNGVLRGVHGERRRVRGALGRRGQGRVLFELVCAGFSTRTRRPGLLQARRALWRRRPGRVRGFTKAHRIPELVEEEAACDATTSFAHTSGGYKEACGGADGDLDGFEGLALQDARDMCCANVECAGFSFDNATGNGMFKKNTECGFNPSDVYDGYTKPTEAWSSWLSGRRGGW